jgi:hypothetical protein
LKHVKKLSKNKEYYVQKEQYWILNISISFKSIFKYDWIPAKLLSCLLSKNFGGTCQADSKNMREE